MRVLYEEIRYAVIWFTYPFVEHLFFMKSNSLMVGPHLSGLEFLGHKVTVGKVNSSIGYVIVSSTVIVGLSYQTI